MSFLSDLNDFHCSLPITLARTSSTVLNRSGKNVYHCLVLRIKAFSLSPWSMMLAVGFPYMTFITICWNSFLLFLVCWMFLSWNNWSLSNDFSASIKMFMLMWSFSLIGFYILKNPWMTGINPTQSWFLILLLCCWTLLVCSFFPPSFHLLVFSVVSLSDIGAMVYIRAMLALCNKLEMVSSLNLLKSWRIGVNSFLNIW